MDQEKNDIYQTAEVILLIIKYEGEIEDIIEYPSEFEAAYQELLQYKIIKKGEDKYLPALNFKKAQEMGLRKYIEKINKPSKFKKYISSKPALVVLTGAAVVTAGYLMRLEKRYML